MTSLRGGQVVFNSAIRYVDSRLMVDDVTVESIADAVETPVYIYSLKRIQQNLHRIRNAFSAVGAHVHYSAKANSNLDVLRTLVEAGAGIDAVSGGEIARALRAGARAGDIVFAGVGKTRSEIEYALECGVGWLNVENVLELDYINAAAQTLGLHDVKVALRLNPQVTANTHPHIATGHGAAKFGLTTEAIQGILAEKTRYPRLRIAGMHIHIGSQLDDAAATALALETLLELIQPYPEIRTINIGGGLPVAFRFDEKVSPVSDFVKRIEPLLKGYQVLLEPGRSIVADAGILVAAVLYVKRQAGQIFYIVDAGMSELIRPALYQAHHEIAPLNRSNANKENVQVVGPVCETADILASDREMPRLQVGDRVAVMTAGAYGMVMASNYNSRFRPAEVVVAENGGSWRVSRRRETLEDFLRYEL